MLKTPKTKFLAVFVLGVLVLLPVWYFYPSEGSKYAKQQGKMEREIFYMPIAIEKYSFGQIPCVEVEIENKKTTLEVDLGFAGKVSLDEDILSTLQEKSFYLSTFSYGFRGKKYEKDVYKVPRMDLGQLTFSSLMIETQNRELIKDSALNSRKDAQVTRASGRIGWRLFNRSGLLLDLNKSLIAVCDSFETLLCFSHQRLSCFFVKSSCENMSCVLYSYGSLHSSFNRMRCKSIFFLPNKFTYF